MTVNESLFGLIIFLIIIIFVYLKNSGKTITEFVKELREGFN